MKKILIIFFLLITPLFSNNFKILKYNVDIILLKNSDVQITENIEVYFDKPKRGIFRFIPYRYKNKIFNDNLRIKIISVEMNGKDENYKIYKKGRNILIRIGKKNRYIQGKNNYKIVYEVKNVIKFYKNHNEFYWNIIGTNWKIPIYRVSFSIFFPKVKPELLKVKLYTGRFFQKVEIKNLIINEDSIYPANYISLPPETGITIGIIFPQGIFKNKSLFIRSYWFFIDNFGLFIPLIFLIIIFILWWKIGKDEQKGVIVVQYYPPDNITPAEAGTLIDDKVDLRDIISTILSLAVKGFLKIKKEKKEILFEKLNNNIEKLKPHEKIIFEGIFEKGDRVSLNSLKGSFYYTIEKASSFLYNILTNKEKYFSANPEKIRNLFKNIGFFLLFIGTIVYFYGLAIYRWDIGFGLILSGIIITVFSKYMPQKTHKGAELYRKILGFKEFMEKVEKPVIEKLIREDENYFSKTLPYAVAFNIEKNWVKKFEGIDFKIPEWYTFSGVYTGYSPIMLYSALSEDLNTMHENFSFIPEGESSFSNIDITGGSFGSGGFSGGGFGGGGGGSW